MSQYPANPMQAAAFLRHEAAPRDPGAIRQISISFGESIDQDLLRKAWSAVFNRHPILRSAFIKSGNAVMVREAAKADPDWIEFDWRSIPQEDLPAKWNDLLVRDADNEFEALAVPLLRWYAIQLPGGAWHYLLSSPSYLIDEFSTTRILIDLLLVLGDASIAPAASMPVPSKAKGWENFLKGAKAPQVLFPRLGDGSSVRASMLLNRDKTAEFSAFCLQHDLEESLVVRCLFGLLLRRLGAKGNVMKVLFDARGDSAEAGYFQNWLPVAQAWLGPVREWLAEEQERADAMDEHTWIEPDTAILEAGLDFSASEIPVSYAWKTGTINTVIHTALPRWINFDAQPRQIDAGGVLLEARPGPRLELSLCGPFSTEAATKEVLARLAGLISEISEIYNKPVDRMPLLPPDEIRVLRDWTRGRDVPATPPSLVDAFRDVVDVNADAIAIRCGDYAMTYLELNELSDKLAAHMTQVGFAGGWHTGLIMSPSAWVGVALLGSWKAGNSCIALDPEADSDWIEQTLAAHDVAVVICDMQSMEGIDQSQRRCIVIDQDWDSLELALIEPREIKAEQLAATLPGHMGCDLPILAALTHGTMAAAALEGARVMDFKAGEAFLVRAVPGGGAFFDEWLIPLLSGGTAFIPEEELNEPATAPVTHLRLTTPEWANQAAAWLRGGAPAANSLRVVAVEAGTPSQIARTVWHTRLHPPLHQVVFSSPAGLCGMGLAGAARKDLATLSAGKPTGDVRISLADEDGMEVLPGFAASVHMKFPGWKNQAGAAGRLGIELGLLGWRDKDGDVFLESAERSSAGVPAAAENLARMPFHSHALDVFVSGDVFVLSTDEVPGAVRIDEWPLNRGGWVDVNALTGSKDSPSPTMLSEKSPADGARAVLINQPPPPRRRSLDAWSPIVKMQPGQGGELLVLVHAASGDPADYAELLMALGPERPVIGIEARGTLNPESCHPSVESAAAQYIAALFEEERPQEYQLAGYGFGGTVVLEMARQLTAAGRVLPRIVLFGSTPPRHESPGGWLYAVKKVLKKNALPLRMEPGEPTSDIEKRHQELWTAYRTGKFDFPATVILPADAESDAAAVWSEILPKADFEVTKSPWACMLDFPAVKRVASILNCTSASPDGDNAFS
jgi:hypothetical protein